MFIRKREGQPDVMKFQNRCLNRWCQIVKSFGHLAEKFELQRGGAERLRKPAKASLVLTPLHPRVKSWKHFLNFSRVQSPLPEIL